MSQLMVILQRSNLISCGVLQGSVLGPILFLLYIYDILTFHLFADDTNIYFSSNNLDLIQSTLNTRVFLYKNKLYKNTQAEIWLKF